MIDYIVEHCEGRRNASRTLMTNVKVYYTRAVSTDDGFFRVAYMVCRLGESYNGRVAPVLLDTRDEVLLDLGSLRPRTILRIVRKL